MEYMAGKMDEQIESANRADVISTLDDMEWWARPQMTTKDHARVMQARRYVENLLSFTRDCANNYDCDSDAHKYGTQCRACAARQLLQPNA